MKELLYRFLVFAVALAAYINTLGHGFVYDDFAGILNRTSISSAVDLGSVMNILREPWRPFLQWTYALTFYLAGFNPFVFHLTNVLIHAINCLLVFQIASSLGAAYDRPRSGPVELLPLAAGLMHAVHPLYTEAVAYVWGRSSLLCATFYFGAILLVLIARNREGRVRWALYSGTALCGILAWMTKEEAITLPLAIALLFLIDVRGGNRKAILVLALLPAAVGLLQWNQIANLYDEVSQNRALVSVGLEPSLPPLDYFRTHVKASVTYYLLRFIYPFDLNAEPTIEPVTRFTDPGFVLSFLLLGMIAASVLVFMKHEPFIAFGLGVLILSPLTSYALLPLADVVAEHRVYIAGLGIDLIAAWLLTVRRRLTMPLIAVLTLGLGFAAIQRNRVWADSMTLWSDAEKKSPERLRPHINLGEVYQSMGANDLALEEYQHALKLQPNLSPAYVNMGSILLARGDLKAAEDMFRKALEISPEIAEPWINLAIIAMRRGEGSIALEHVEEAVRANPKSYLAHFTRGDVLLMLGRVDEAENDYREAIELRPDIKELEEQVQIRLAQIDAWRKEK